MPNDLNAKVRKIYQEAYNEGNLDALNDLIDTRYLRHQPPMKDVQGLEAYKAFISEVRDAYTDFNMVLDETLTADNKTVVRLTLKGKHTGKIPTLRTPPTGKEIAMPGCVISTWDDGKIVEEWVYNDYLGLAYQFGVTPIITGSFE
ncbi:MAG: ester cyclase [Desulforhopalus sp.]